MSKYPSGCTAKSGGADKEESKSTPVRVQDQRRAARVGEVFGVVVGAHAPKGEIS